MCDLRRIRQYLTPEVAVLAANTLISSLLDYCNYLFRGLSRFNQHKLQNNGNTLARIATNHRKYTHVTPILKQFHWLHVKYQCIFKTATLVCKFCIVVLLRILNRSCLSVVVSIVPDIVTQIVNTLQFLLSTHQSLSQLKILAIVFAFDTPKIWNELPHDVRSATSFSSISKKLKSYLFAKAYPPQPSLSPLCLLGITWLFPLTYANCLALCSDVPSVMEIKLYKSQY